MYSFTIHQIAKSVKQIVPNPDQTMKEGNHDMSHVYKWPPWWFLYPTKRPTTLFGSANLCPYFHMGIGHLRYAILVFVLLFIEFFLTQLTQHSMLSWHALLTKTVAWKARSPVRKTLTTSVLRSSWIVIAGGGCQRRHHHFVLRLHNQSMLSTFYLLWGRCEVTVAVGAGTLHRRKNHTKKYCTKLYVESVLNSQRTSDERWRKWFGIIAESSIFFSKIYVVCLGERFLKKKMSFVVKRNR